jgi:hypothetical protein
VKALVDGAERFDQVATSTDKDRYRRRLLGQPGLTALRQLFVSE